MQNDYVESLRRRKYEIFIQQKPSFLKMQQGAHLLPSHERTLAPARIGANRSPHLSPVGSLTNLLTDLSSTGFKHNNLISLMSKQEYATLNAIKIPITQSEHGLHMYSPRVESSINKHFSVREKQDSERLQLDSFRVNETNKAMSYLKSPSHKKIVSLGNLNPPNARLNQIFLDDQQRKLRQNTLSLNQDSQGNLHPLKQPFKTPSKDLTAATSATQSRANELSIRKVLANQISTFDLNRKNSELTVPSIVKGMFHSRMGVGHSASKVNSKADLQTMIQNSEQRIDMLHKASPLITNAEAMLGSLKALCQSETTSNPVLPLGSLNSRREIQLFEKLATSRNLSL